MRKFTLFLLSLLMGLGWALAQQEVSGTVLSAEDGQPLIGAAVFVKGSPGIGRQTDVNGKFAFQIPKDAKTLMVTYVGMKAQEVAVGKDLKIVLEMDSEQLDEVIVVAYGTAKKSTFTGSASTVNAKSIESRPISNVTQAISGAAPGVQVTAGSGQPGSGIAIRIRGFGSINASSSPLYVVDGAVYDGSISDLNPSDIENLSILKDAASTSLYGSSAGNGVVLITTKKGRKGQDPRFTVTTSLGLSERAFPEYDKVDVFDYYPVMWKQLYNNYLFGDKKTAERAAKDASKNLYKKYLYYNPFRGVNPEEIVLSDGTLNPEAKDLLYGDDLDWLKGVERRGNREEVNLNFSYANDKISNYSSLGYIREEGYSLKTFFERFSARTNVNYKVNEWLSTGVNMSGFRTRSQGLGSEGNSSYANPFFFARFIGPIYPIHLHDMETGEYILDGNGKKIYDYNSQRGSGAFTGRHVIAETLFSDNEGEKEGINARIHGELKLMPGLSFRSQLAYDHMSSMGRDYKNTVVGDAQGEGRLSISNGRRTSVTFNQILHYDKIFDEVHHLDAMLGHENYAYQYRYNGGRKGKQNLEGIIEWSNFITPEGLDSYTSRYRKEGYFGRLNYDYRNTYYLSLSYRRDGSSRFSTANRWGNFYSAGLSWRLTQEDFMKDIRWVDDLKLRASYGETGNDNLSSLFPYLSLFAIGYDDYDMPGILFATAGDAKLKWETQVSYDAAVDFRLFNRLRGTIEYFNKESKDLLFSEPLPVSSGANDIDRNIGKIRNSGVEVDLAYDIIQNRDFRWTVKANATFLKNRIVKLPEGQEEIMNGTKKWVVGHSMYDYWLRQFEGVNPEDGMPLYRMDTDKYDPMVKDKRGNLSLASDVIVQGTDTLTTNYKKAAYDWSGSSIPVVYGGFGTTFAWKGLELSAMFTYQLGGKAYDNTYASLMGMNDFGAAIHIDAKNKTWKTPGEIAEAPRLDAGQSSTINAASSRWLITSNALALKSLSLGYNLPKAWASAVRVKNIKLSLSGENLYFFTARKGLNPMQNYSGTNSNVYSTARTFTFSASLTF